MYERHFGLSGPPFQLNPDPAFYFDSRGHNNALAYLNFGVHQGEGFIVVTGEVGAGKTTLVRKLLGGLGAHEVVAAQIASTQLGADDLLRSVLRAFGETTQGRSKAEVIAALEAYLTSLSAVGRRALLVVDEAQNLQPEAIEELRMLSNFQWGPQPVLQSFLVGQPELRAKLQLPWMEPLRQRVIASCHLGPLEAGETRAYVEHRLRRVGWVARPAFDDAAFEQVHRWSQGLPRRINLLCNRLMLAAYLGDDDRISAQGVAQVAADFRGELGHSAAQPGAEPETGVPPAHGPSAREAAEAPASPPPAAVEAAARAGCDLRPLVELRPLPPGMRPSSAPMLCVVDTPATRLRCAVLAQALAAQRDMPPLLVVHAGPAAAWEVDPELNALLPEPAMVAHLGAPAGSFAVHTAEVQLRFAQLQQQWSPSSLLLLGQGDAALACALVAAKLDLPVFRVAAAGSPLQRVRGDPLNAALLDTLCELSLREAPALAAGAAGATAPRPGDAPVPPLQPVGSLMAAAMARLGPALPDARAVWRGLLPAPWPERPLVIVSCQWEQPLVPALERGGLVETLCELAGPLAVLWLADGPTRQALAHGGLDRRLAEAGVQVMAPPAVLACLGLLRGAACLLHGSQGLWAEEAEALGTAAVGPGDLMRQAVMAAAAGGGQGRVAALADPGQAGADIVALLRRWRLRERLAGAAAGSRDWRARPSPADAVCEAQGPRSTAGEDAWGHKGRGSEEPSTASDQVLDETPAWAVSSGSA